jgi:hypothetical protein
MTQRPSLLEQVERFEAAAQELRAMISETHSATKALRQAVREAHEVRKQIEEAARVAVEERISAEIQTGLDEYRASLDLALVSSTEAMHKRFDTLTNILMTGDVKGPAVDALHALFTAPSGRAAPEPPRRKRGRR